MSRERCSDILHASFHPVHKHLLKFLAMILVLHDLIHQGVELMVGDLDIIDLKQHQLVLPMKLICH